MKKCELCNEKATVYCEADEARLCRDCDNKVHGANFLVSRHIRILLCRSCQELTPWQASGPKLGHTFSVCCRCAGDEIPAPVTGEEREVPRPEGLSDGCDCSSRIEEYHNGETLREGEVSPPSRASNPAINVSTPPPPPSCSSCDESSSESSPLRRGFFGLTGNNLDRDDSFPARRISFLSSRFTREYGKSESESESESEEDSVEGCVSSGGSFKSVNFRRRPAESSLAGGSSRRRRLNGGGSSSSA